jgi:hypothetical protein
VFTTTTGHPQNHRNAPRAVHDAGNRTKLNSDVRPRVGLQDLRHSFVALALASRLTLARRADPRITAMAYARLTDDARAGLGAKLWRHLTWLLCQHRDTRRSARRLLPAARGETTARRRTPPRDPHRRPPRVDWRACFEEATGE